VKAEAAAVEDHGEKDHGENTLKGDDEEGEKAEKGQNHQTVRKQSIYKSYE
jgi:hypothetical protein